MVWITFLCCGAMILLVGTVMTRNADVIAERTGLGKAFVGGILLAGATSAPELMTNISAAQLGSADLVVGNVLGSNLCNMALLGVVDLWHRRVSVLANVALAQSFAAALAVLLTVMTGVFIHVRLTASLAGLGLDVLILVVIYVLGMWLLRATEEGGHVTGTPLAVLEEPPAGDAEPAVTPPPIPRRPPVWRQALPRAGASFLVCTLVIVLVAPRLASSADRLAEQTGLGRTFVGTALLSLMTSLPELTASWVAVRMGSYDLAVGNLFGSNAINIALLGVGDFCFAPGNLLSAAQPVHALTAMLASALMMIALMSVVFRGARRPTFVQFDASLMVVCYLAAMAVLYSAGR